MAWTPVPALRDHDHYNSGRGRHGHPNHAIRFFLNIHESREDNFQIFDIFSLYDYIGPTLAPESLSKGS